MPLHWSDGIPLGIVAGAAICIVAAVRPIWAILRFRDARTQVKSHKPTAALVVTCPYRFTRNPICLDFLFLVAGFALFLPTLGR